MGYQPTVFNQLFNFIPRHVFEKSAKHHGADRYAKTFKAWHQFLLLLYAQSTAKQSLRDIVGGLQLHRSKLPTIRWTAHPTGAAKIPPLDWSNG